MLTLSAQDSLLKERTRGESTNTLPRILILAQRGIGIKNLFFGPLLPALKGRAEVRILTDYYDDPQLLALVSENGASFAPFLYSDFNGRGLTGRLESFLVSCWDYGGISKTRLNKRRLFPEQPRNSLHTMWLFGLKLAQKTVTAMKLLEALDEMVEERLLQQHPTEQMIGELGSWKADVVLSTWPYRATDMAIARTARRLGIPVLACLTSWDNLTSKNRMTFTYDGYLLWSEQMRVELHRLYEKAHRKPCWILGAPNFDPHFDLRWRLSRKEFCRRLGLDPARKIVLYGTGSRGLAAEHLYCKSLARAMRTGRLGSTQLLVRLHPLNEDSAYAELQAQFPEVVVRYPGQANLGMLPGSPSPTTEGVTELVNSLLHADVVVNIASTLTIDAALLDTPIVNVAYELDTAAQNKIPVKDVYTIYEHYRPILDSGGVRLVRSEDELIQGVNQYLFDPTLDQEGRRRIVEIEVGLADGHAGERIAEMLLEVAEKTQKGMRPSW